MCLQQSCLSRELSGMLDDAVPGLEHAFDLATLSALRQPLDALTKVTEGTVFLLPLTLVTLDCRIGRKFNDWPLRNCNEEKN